MVRALWVQGRACLPPVGTMSWAMKPSRQCDLHPCGRDVVAWQVTSSWAVLATSDCRLEETTKPSGFGSLQILEVLFASTTTSAALSEVSACVHLHTYMNLGRSCDFGQLVSRPSDCAGRLSQCKLNTASAAISEMSARVHLHTDMNLRCSCDFGQLVTRPSDCAGQCCARPLV
mmetsp:Transcript_135326/g.432659  ORF Transcript_135326/g.432659 Transcript_135326/m.432659 type:complete len:174 (-) Transcript_135326:198-719(-)